MAPKASSATIAESGRLPRRCVAGQPCDPLQFANNSSYLVWLWRTAAITAAVKASLRGPCRLRPADATASSGRRVFGDGSHLIRRTGREQCPNLLTHSDNQLVILFAPPLHFLYAHSCGRAFLGVLSSIPVPLFPALLFLRGPCIATPRPAETDDHSVRLLYLRRPSCQGRIARGKN